ncbi:hypothetical protein [Amycolatopsis anabasis]|uniref:hypothetical protein n=1 Tax=Amycolatopsis anabasis TaxID=1840409 RepID=UPI00131D8C45|nr:hypothetical protein [Amycolatopsis anabasis]
MTVVDRFLVTVDRVHQVDERGAPLAVWPGDRLYEHLVLAGVPLTYNNEFLWPIGRADVLDLRIDIAAERVRVVTPGQPDGYPLGGGATRRVLDWYRGHLDTC